MPNEIHAVLFDCDGTLVDSEPISLQVLVDLIGEQGLELEHQAAIDRWSGCDLAEVFAEIETRLGRALPEDFLETFREAQLKRLAVEVQPIPGAAELVKSITVAKCVASNAPLSKVRLCLETTGLLGLFEPDNLFSAYQVEAWKPRPDLFFHAAKQLGVAPGHCVVVEDSQFGIDAGLAAGMIVYAYDPHERLQPTPGVQSVRDLGELVSAIGS